MYLYHIYIYIYLYTYPYKFTRLLRECYRNHAYQSKNHQRAYEMYEIRTKFEGSEVMDVRFSSVSLYG